MIGTTRTYKRDGRAPIPKNEVTSRVMSSIRGKNTKPEIILRKGLWFNGLKGYRLHWTKVPGKPDICYPTKKLAIFVHGCYWHRCPHCQPHSPKSHSEYWENKFLKNVERDFRHQIELKNLGWQYIVIWECEMKKDIDTQIQTVKKALRESAY